MEEELVSCDERHAETLPNNENVLVNCNYVEKRWKHRVYNSEPMYSHHSPECV